MTLFLASVTGADEAETAFAHGADIIDLKDAAKGGLAPLPIDLVRAAVASVAGRRPVSAVAGDAGMDPGTLVSSVQETAGTGVDYVKIGLHPGPQRKACVRALAPVARETKLVAVLFADQQPDFTLLPFLGECGFAGAMLDTARKGSGRLLDHADIAVLHAFVERCRGHGLLCGLAGSLEAPDVPRLLLLAPDLLGFRGALCGGRDRGTRLDRHAVNLIRELIPRDHQSAAGDAISALHPLAAARIHGEAIGREGATDRIFVRDFIMPVRIGAYAHEHGKPQNVRFNVEVTAARPARAAADMRHVLSYDVIMDAIRLVVAREHIALVEALAERIAEFLLAHPRVVSVTVRVEKLDLGPGSVGVEITRQRQSDIAKVYQLYPTAADKARLAGSE
jgi:dihydroneopterin aldolase